MSYLIPAGTNSGASPDSISRRRKMAEALLASGMGAEPIASPWQGAAKMAQALVGGLGVRRADRMEREGRASANKALIDALFGDSASAGSGGATGATPRTAPYRSTTGGIGSDRAAAASGQANQYRDAIRGIETGGRSDPYRTVHPMTEKGSRAYGAYGVMDFNIGPWTKEVLGREMTPEQFLADQNAQDAVFDAKFGQSVQQYGNPQDAASVWFTGRPQAQGGNARDITGTSGNDYVSKFSAALSGQPQVMPASSAGGNREAMIALLQNPWASPEEKAFVLQALKPKAPISVGADETLLDPNTLKPIYQGGAKPTDDTREYEYAKSQGYKGSFEEWQLQNKKAAATNIDLGDSSFAKEFGKQNAQNFFERRQVATDAVASLQSGQQARQLLDSGVITGAGADWIVGAGKALQTMGFKVADDPIANTEAFVATRAQEVGRIIKLFGAGTGLSDADREFATQAAAGKINLNESSLRRILDINDRAARNVIELFNKDALQIDPKLSPYPLQVEMPSLPATPPPPQTAPATGNEPVGTVFDSIEQIPEGATVDDNGVLKIKRNGQLIPVQ